MNDTDVFYVDGDVPDASKLPTQFQKDVNDAASFVSRCERNYNNRRAIWPGQTGDFKKTGEDAFPWPGASDQEYRLIEMVISTIVSEQMNALDKANIQANPVEGGDIRRASIATSFIKWMKQSYISNFRKEMEMSANHMLEKSITVTSCEWERSLLPVIRKIDIDEIAEVVPELAEMIVDEAREDEAIGVLMGNFEGVTKKRARKAIRQARKTGIAELPTVTEINRPIVKTIQPDYDFVIPEYTGDIQDASHCHIISYMTPADIENGVNGQNWDRDWADAVIAECRGKSTSRTNSTRNTNTRYLSRTVATENENVIEVVSTYRKIVDREDGSTGIYRTVFCPHAPESAAKHEGYAIHELLDGVTEYPFVVTRLIEGSSNLRDSVGIADMLRGPQYMAKTIMDSWVNQQSLNVAPPLLHPPNNIPTNLGANALISARVNDRFEYLKPPTDLQTDIRAQEYTVNSALSIVGINADGTPNPQRIQFYINKFLDHAARVLRMTFDNFRNFGEEEMFVRVTGHPDPVHFQRDELDMPFDVQMSFDMLMNDPKNTEYVFNSLMMLLDRDRNNDLSVAGVMSIGVNMLGASIADQVLLSQGASQQEVVQNVSDDIAKIHAGIPVGARPNGAEAAIAFIDQYVEMNQEKLMADAQFAQRLSDYRAQYDGQLIQAANAQTGRLLAQPASVGDISTQDITG